MSIERTKTLKKTSAKVMPLKSSKRTLAREVYHQLREDILSGKYPPKSKLKMERLVETYNVGMSPLREALSRLVGDMLVITEEQRGFWVAPLSLADLDDLTQMRSLLETHALSQSIQHGGSEWEKALRESYEQLAAVEQKLPDSSAKISQSISKQWEEQNEKFHATLVSACNSPWLIRMRDILYQQSERYRRISLREGRGHRDIHDEHRSIFEAAINRNTLKACSLIEYHIRQTSEELRRSILGDNVFEEHSEAL